MHNGWLNKTSRLLRQVLALQKKEKKNIKQCCLSKVCAEVTTVRQVLHANSSHRYKSKYHRAKYWLKSIVML